MYGYLPKSIKDTVNEIVREIAKEENVSKLNAEWNRINREKLSLYHEKETMDIPLEENNEFRHIKNLIIKAAVKMDRYYTLNALESRTPIAIAGVVLNIARIMAGNCMKKRQKLRTQIDSKLKQKIKDKKKAQGLKSENLEYDYGDYGFTL